MTAPERARLVLWDVDHTLIETRGIGRAIYERAFPKVTGQPLRALATVQGRTELDIIHDTLELHGIPATDETVNRMADALAEGYRESLDELARQGRVLPGARDALTLLAADPHVHQSVLTGNTTAVAALKIKAFDLDSYLDLSIGAYGDDHRDRVALVAIARQRAQQRLNLKIEPNQIVLIGDTPNDISAALAANTQLIAVASGKYTTDELAAAGATSPLNDLTDTRQLRHAFAQAGLTTPDIPNRQRPHI